MPLVSMLLPVNGFLLQIRTGLLDKMDVLLNEQVLLGKRYGKVLSLHNMFKCGMPPGADNAIRLYPAVVPALKAYGP